MSVKLNNPKQTNTLLTMFIKQKIKAQVESIKMGDGSLM